MKTETIGWMDLNNYPIQGEPILVQYLRKGKREVCEGYLDSTHEIPARDMDGASIGNGLTYFDLSGAEIRAPIVWAYMPKGPQ